MSRGQSLHDAQLDAEPVVCWDLPEDVIDAEPPAPTPFELEFDPDRAVEWLLRNGPAADSVRTLLNLDPSALSSAAQAMVATLEAARLRFLAALPDPTLEVGVWSLGSAAVAKQDWIRESVS